MTKMERQLIKQKSRQVSRIYPISPDLIHVARTSFLPIHHTLGNQGIQRLIQAKLNISQPNTFKAFKGSEYMKLDRYQVVAVVRN